MTKQELITQALKTMSIEEKRKVFPPMTKKNFVVRENWLGRNQIITFTNKKGQTITYDHDEVLNVMLPQLKLSPNWLKRKYWSQSTNLPKIVFENQETCIIDIVEPKKSKSTKR